MTLPDLPYDLRVPAAAGGLPKTNSGPARAKGVQIPPNPKYPQVVLYDQYNNAGANASSSQDFEAAFDLSTTSLPTTSSCPAARIGRWSRLTRMECTSTAGPAASFNVRFYTNGAGNLPGTLVEARLAQSYVQGGTTFSITLSPAVALAPGTYWVSVQARKDFCQRPVGMDRPDGAVQRHGSLAKPRWRLRGLPYLDSKADLHSHRKRTRPGLPAQRDDRRRDAYAYANAGRLH